MLTSQRKQLLLDRLATDGRLVATDLACTIVTHSPSIAAALEAHDRIEVILFGGRLFRHSMVAMGAATVAGYAGLRAELCLLGVTGVHPDCGLTTGDAEEAALKRTMMAAAAETAVLATDDKLGAVSPWIIAPLPHISWLVTTTFRPDWLSAEIEHLPA